MRPFSGTGYAVQGQTFEQNPNVDWVRQEMANYTRTSTGKRARAGNVRPASRAGIRRL